MIKKYLVLYENNGSKYSFFGNKERLVNFLSYIEDEKIINGKVNEIIKIKQAEQIYCNNDLIKNDNHLKQFLKDFE